MCKNPNAVIANAKKDTPEVYQLRNNNGELEGLCLVHNHTLAIAYEIKGDDELNYFSKSSTENVTNMFEFVRRLFGVDDGFIRQFYSVAAA